MKNNIHPDFYTDAKVVCACGNTFVTGSTVKELHTELCSACHPFFTGKQKLVDTAGRVDRFKAKMQKAEEMKKKAEEQSKKKKGKVKVIEDVTEKKKKEEKKAKKTEKKA